MFKRNAIVFLPRNEKMFLLTVVAASSASVVHYDVGVWLNYLEKIIDVLVEGELSARWRMLWCRELKIKEVGKVFLVEVKDKLPRGVEKVNQAYVTSNQHACLHFDTLFDTHFCQQLPSPKDLVSPCRGKEHFNALGFMRGYRYNFNYALRCQMRPLTSAILTCSHGIYE